MARLWFCPSIVQYTRTRKLKSRIDSLEKKLKCQDTRRQSTTRSLALSALRPGTLSGLGSTGLGSTSPNNIWLSLINKTFKQLNAERAARRARPNKKIKLKKLVLKLNKENAPPDGWRPEDKVPSSQAGGPAPKGSGNKQPA